MAFTVESKSQLAKLLATENLTIEHQKLSTAKFDPKNRVLYCPIWQDMSGALYDLLMGHEVGHALYTPAEGWHDAVSTLGKKYKGFLNVVEDARIEKKVKRKFPGIRASFAKGYQNLLDRDFFGLKSRDINTMSFIDRLNIYTKSAGLTKVEFSDKEMVMVRQVEACETWEDVLRVTKTIFNYSKNEQFETMQQALASMVESQSGQSDGGDEYDESDSDYDGDSDEDGEDGDYSDDENTDTDGKDKKQGKQSDEESDNAGNDGDSDEDGENDGNKMSRDKDSKASDRDQFEPTCETDENFRSNESSLLSAESKNYVYGKIPKPNLDAIVTPVKRVQEILSKYYFDPTGSKGFEQQYTEKLREFKSKNDRYIGLLAKEFEMKKAARAYAKAKVSNTGDIDINRLYKYQVEDNIFKKMMKIPKGKSHGLVLLLDRSGSMSRNMAGSIEQILVLTMFCRKVNIPFTVYGFGDACDGRMVDFPNEDRTVKGFKPEANEFAFETVYLREYLNSKMSNVEYNRATRNLIALRDSYAENARGRWGIGRPHAESLGNTPLIQAMVALEPITQQFRKVNNLDLVNLVIVHDGDADNSNSVMQERNSYEWENKPGQKIVKPSSFHPRNDNVYIKDRDSKLQIKVESCVNDSYYTVEDGLRVGIFDWYKAKTGAKIFGFFIAGQTRDVRNGITNKYVDKNGKTVREQVYADNPQAARYQQLPKTEYVKNLSKQLQSEKFLQSYNKGYDLFFILPGGNELQIEDEELVVNGVVTANKLKTAFMKMNKKKAVSRVMVSRFIDGIAS